MVPAFISLIYTVAPMRLSPLSLSATYPLRVCLSCAKDIIGRKKINNKYLTICLNLKKNQNYSFIPERGKIYDRNGKLLSTTVNIFFSLFAFISKL